MLLNSREDVVISGVAPGYLSVLENSAEGLSTILIRRGTRIGPWPTSLRIVLVVVLVLDTKIFGYNNENEDGRRSVVPANAGFIGYGAIDWHMANFYENEFGVHALACLK